MPRLNGYVIGFLYCAIHYVIAIFGDYSDLHRDVFFLFAILFAAHMIEQES